MEAAFSPTQEETARFLKLCITAGRIVVLWGKSGSGKTTLLRSLHQETGGAFLTLRDFFDRVARGHPLALEEAFQQMLLDALREHDQVILDDLDLITGVCCNCRPSNAYPRAGLLDVPAKIAAVLATETGKTLVIGTEGNLPAPLRARAHFANIGEFGIDDYAHLCRAFLGEAASELDFAKIHRFAPHLDGHQLCGICEWLRPQGVPSTETFIRALRKFGMQSNVSLEEVQKVSLADLYGCEEVVRSLETNIVLPLEQSELAEELGLAPKRGVLLAGPPGTGKTTVGRALAHRLEGKFFLVDGTVIAGTRNFYSQIHQIFEAARKNAPSIIFIDDSDVIFKASEDHGLYRYLLTALDGLESESSGQVCVMMTAMNVADLPAALLRSGRIELWLETRLPDNVARRDILTRHLSGLPAALGTPDLEALVEATHGFTGADLKRLVQDGKNLYAYDRVHGQPLQEITHYLLRAVESVAGNKLKYAEAESLAAASPPIRRPRPGV